MQVKWSRLHISDSPLQQPDFKQILPISSGISQPIHKLDLLELRTPIISILYAYQLTEQYRGCVLELEIELLIKGEKIYYKELRYVKYEGYLYKEIEIGSCLCYQKPITSIIGIKISQASQEQTSLQQLITQLSQRQYILHNDKSLINYKRDLIIKQPLSTSYRYQSVDLGTGYVWIKCTNTREDQVRIVGLRLMNWDVGNGNGRNQDVRGFGSKSTMDGEGGVGGNGVGLNKGEEFGVMMTINSQLRKIQIPYILEFVHSSCPDFKFKLIKYLYIQ